jgi:hypothetical protein
VRLRLQPLTESESTLVVQNLLGEAGIPRAVCAAVVRASEGNPLFVEQMLSMLVDDGLLRRVDGGWRPAAGIEDVRVPPTINALLSARLDALDPEERAVVEPAAVIGHQFAAAAVRELGAEDLRLGDRLSRSVQRVGLIRYDAFEDMGGRLSFSCAMLDEHGTGVVVTSINGRQDTRVYAKPVVNGSSDHNLSEEEEDAIREALAGKAREAVRAR